MRRIKITVSTAFILLTIGTKAQQTPDTIAILNSIFPRGEKSTANENFNGGVAVNRYVSLSDSLNSTMALVTFDAGVRTNWHIHPGGQIIMVMYGPGYYQEKGKPRQIIHKGDVIKCTRGIAHWHGASPNGEFAHLVAAADTRQAEVTWLQKVTEEEYNGVK